MPKTEENECDRTYNIDPYIFCRMKIICPLSRGDSKRLWLTINAADLLV